MPKFDPKERPGGLKPAEVKGKEPPVKVPPTAGDEETFEWLEALRDHHQEKGELLTVQGMNHYADAVGVDEEDTKALKKQINKFYKDEKSDGGESPAAAPKKAKKSETSNAKEKKVAVATKTEKKANGRTMIEKTTKAAGKVEKAGGLKPKPGKNGKASAKVEKKTSPKKTGGEDKVLIDTTVQGVPVKLIQKPNGTLRGTAFGKSLRGLIRFYGSKNKTPVEAREAVGILLKKFKGDKKYEDGEAYAASMVEEGHLRSGKDGEKGSFGPAPEYKKDEARALLALIK